MSSCDEQKGLKLHWSLQTWFHHVHWRYCAWQTMLLRRPAAIYTLYESGMEGFTKGMTRVQVFIFRLSDLICRFRWRFVWQLERTGQHLPHLTDYICVPTNLAQNYCMRRWSYVMYWKRKIWYKLCSYVSETWIIMLVPVSCNCAMGQSPIRVTCTGYDMRRFWICV